MSYILESIKKSERERNPSMIPSALAVSSPDFLDNEIPWGMIPKLLVILLVVVIILAMVGIWHLATVSSLAPGVLQSKSISPHTSNPQQITPLEQPVVGAELTSKEEAVRLYQQALINKTQTKVDELYNRAEQFQSAQDSSTVEAIASVEPSLSVEDSPEFMEALNSLQEESKTVNEPLIPTIYELDTSAKKAIPAINYGAHVFATDNKSGFVILDGVRRKVGDQLENGVFVEKISEEEVVLSFNGQVFSLPAMKSWLGN